MERIDRSKFLYVSNPKVAKELINQDYMIQDIGPNPENRDKTLFYFKRSKCLKELLESKYNYVI